MRDGQRSWERGGEDKKERDSGKKRGRRVWNDGQKEKKENKGRMEKFGTCPEAAVAFKAFSRHAWQISHAEKIVMRHTSYGLMDLWTTPEIDYMRRICVVRETFGVSNYCHHMICWSKITWLFWCWNLFGKCFHGSLCTFFRIVFCAQLFHAHPHNLCAS